VRDPPLTITVNSLNTERSNISGKGTQTTALAYGGALTTSGTSTGATETWNGTSWTSNPTSLATARQAMGGTGTQTASLGFGGSTTTQVSATEKWTGVGTQTITTS
jgi:hypothetical protein